MTSSGALSGALRNREAHPPIGILLREWRAARRMSQLDLALEADMSARHLSCVETGKAQASRETIARLADALGMPLRGRNALLLAGGYAPRYAENDLATPALDRMRQAIELIIAQQEPYPAFVLDRHWNVLMVNEAAIRVNHFLMKGRESPHGNILHQVFDPDDFRSVIANWSEVAAKFIRLLHEEIAAVPSDHKAQQLLHDVLQYPDVPARWRFRDMENEPSPVLTLVFNSDAGELRFFETITTFATPRDVTLDELRIECAFPADEHTAAICAELARSAQTGASVSATA
ncbi:helix-turn-helix transcriptional regulator [Sphingomonas sp. So64.6b]|uniref:helix-turn-helix domain-containing protein n=1 Tax=Sphingomonas sp. So64.6b TaxID=2997354 RepID=UPI00160293A4|nr:helix-turn-helix transcriptional regulator [Sphingomonas sp. So64.6b]QNA84681.1 helix-turn-helix transcriptional regulator [Sphingomonas sp. So64.6b]